MAYSAICDDTWLVTGVYAAPDTLEQPAFDDDMRSTDERMTDYFNSRGVPGTARQASFNARIRKRFPGVGFSYNADIDAFVEPQPYPSWTLDPTGTWQPPVPRPDSQDPYSWNEEAQEWQLVQE